MATISVRPYGIPRPTFAVKADGGWVRAELTQLDPSERPRLAWAARRAGGLANPGRARRPNITNSSLHPREG